MFYVIKNNNKGENIMKKKILYLFLTIVSVVSLIGCGNSESSEEASEAVSATQGNALESAFLSEDHFELREESITLEYGTPLSEDISEYVIAKDYEGITCEYEEISYNDALEGQAGNATFINQNSERLTMNVYYTDTTPPAITNTEYTFYALRVNASNSIKIIEEKGTTSYGGENFNKDEDVFNRGSILDFFGVTDNTNYINTSIVIDNILYDYENTDHSYGWDRIPSLDYGDHTVILNGCDEAGNIATFECKLYIVADVSPEEREWLASEYGYTEEQINTAVEEYVSQMEN